MPDELPGCSALVFQIEASKVEPSECQSFTPPIQTLSKQRDGWRYGLIQKTSSGSRRFADAPSMLRKKNDSDARELDFERPPPLTKLD